MGHENGRYGSALSRNATFIFIGIIVAWLTAAASMHALDVAQPTWFAALDAFITADGFLLAAAFRALHWRTTRDPGLLVQALGLGGAAIVLPASALIAPWGIGAGAESTAATTTRALVLAAVFPLLAARWLDTRASVARAVASSGALIALLVAAAIWTPGPIAYLLVEGLLVIGWTVLADRASGTAGWFGVAMCLLAVAETTRLIGYALPTLFDGYALGFDVAAALLLACVALSDVREEWHAERVEAGALAHDLARARELLADSTRAQRERMHDARSAVAGVIGAAEVLAHAPDPQLQELMVAELNRLVSMLDEERSEPVAEFELGAALGPVVSMHKLICPELTFDLESVRALGRVDATATALDNLLRNARVHAPGADVRVSTRVLADSVEIVVDDSGPGIPVDERDHVLGYGNRGTHRRPRPGSGLGLHSAVGTMRAQAGDLSVGESPTGGARLTMTLPRPAGR